MVSWPSRAAVLSALVLASNQAAADLPTLWPADIVILGEVHDNPQHHLNQAEALRAVQPSAVVFEMLGPDQAAIVNARPDRDAALGAAIGWTESGWPDWSLYQPVFAALGSARVYGMALPREEVRRAVTEGAAAVFAGDAARFGLDGPLEASEQSARETDQAIAHCDALPQDMLPGMVAAQRLRDAHFAAVALNALRATGGPVAVIAGTGHARRDRGIPAALALAAPEVPVFALGQTEMDAPSDTVADAPFDAILAAPPALRDDPCAALRHGAGDADG